MPREGFYCTCLSNSICKTGKNYHPQVFLEVCKHTVEEKKLKDILMMI